MAEPVSVLIPAYRERFFPEALASAVSQRYPDYEVVVCDDSRGDGIERCVAAAASPRVRYIRNGTRLGFAGNFTRCLHEARADLVKFLNDDDRLHHDCIAILAPMMAANASITLATSRRNAIDAEGRKVEGVAATLPVAHVSAIVRGRELGDLALANGLNVIGEPTSVMFRRSRVLLEQGSIFRWGGRDYHCLADLALWLRALAEGFAYYHAEPLSEFRQHEGQEQLSGDLPLECMEEWGALIRQAGTAGFLSTPALRQQALRALRARVLFGGPLDRYEKPARDRLEAVLADADVHL
jgi:glycosyltransferase involved in cell wall biosynthesis